MDGGGLAIGIVTYNNDERQLRQLCRSIEIAARELQPRPLVIRLFVIDNGEESSWDSTGLEVRKLESLGNVGFATAMNALMEVAFQDARIDWFLCLNPDGLLHHAALRHLLAGSRACPNAIVEARQFPEEHLKYYDPATLDTPWASGACLLVPRRVYTGIGGFDPAFFMYMEDVDFSWRVRAAGFSVKVAPQALFGHSVLDREPDPIIQKRFFVSLRYLAQKWRNTEFRQWAEQSLREQGLGAGGNDLPSVSPNPLSESVVASSGAQFTKDFVFAPRRW